MIPGPYTLRIPQGSIVVRYFGYRVPPATDLVDLVGWVARAQVRPSYLASTVYLDADTSTGEIELRGPGDPFVVVDSAGVSREFNIRLEWDAVATALVTTNGVWDFELVPPSGEPDRFTLLTGRALLTREVTRP